MEGINKSDYFHSKLVYIGNQVGMNIISDGWRYNYRLCVTQFIAIYAVVSYFLHLRKFSTDFNYICYSTILTAPAIGKIQDI